MTALCCPKASAFTYPVLKPTRPERSVLEEGFHRPDEETKTPEWAAVKVKAELCRLMPQGISGSALRGPSVSHGPSLLQTKAVVNSDCSQNSVMEQCLSLVC